MHESRELWALTAGVRCIAGLVVIGLQSCLPKLPLPQTAP
jgi:hypothetical protein